jgi:hypothetical protein
MPFKVSVNTLKNTWGFKAKAGSHYMYTDPNRKVGGKNLYISLHGGSDGSTYTFSDFAIKTGYSETSIGCFITIGGQCNPNLNNATWRMLNGIEKQAVRDLIAEMEDLVTSGADYVP